MKTCWSTHANEVAQYRARSNRKMKLSHCTLGWKQKLTGKISATGWTRPVSNVAWPENVCMHYRAIALSFNKPEKLPKSKSRMRAMVKPVMVTL